MGELFEFKKPQRISASESRIRNFDPHELAKIMLYHQTHPPQEAEVININSKQIRAEGDSQ